MIKEFVDHVKVIFPTSKEANDAIAFMQAKIKDSIGHWVSVYDLIGCCSMAPDFAYRFTSEELNDWGWTSIDGYSLQKGSIRNTIILAMPPARKREMINLKGPFKELHINIPRGCGKTMYAMKMIEDICKNNKLREEINSKIKKYSDMDHYGYRFVLEYQHQSRGKRYKVEYRVPFDSSCFLEFWPDEEVDKYLDEQENKARKELIDRVIKDINKGDAETMPTQFDLSGFIDLSKFVIYDSTRARLPQITNIEMYNDRVVKVTFDDGSFTKSVCQENDIFDLDVGITVCLLKKMLDTGKGDGTRIYNDIIRDAHKLIEDKENEKIEQQLEKENQRKKAHKAQMKRQAKKLKAKEEAIDIQKQAYIRALKETGMISDAE